MALVAAAVALALLSAGLPAAWVLLGICALATVPIVVWGIATGRFFEPLPVIAAIGALMFVLRPLQLILEWRDLYSHFFPTDPVRRLVLLEGQEISLFIGDRVTEPLEDTLARSIGACALFLVMLLVGYRLGLGARLARRLEGVRSRQGAINLRAAVGISLAIGLVAQVVIIGRAGGPSGCPGAGLQQADRPVGQLRPLLPQRLRLRRRAALGGVAPAPHARRVGRLRRERARGLHVLHDRGLARPCVPHAARARLIVHYLWRPWRRRELAAGLIVMLAFVSALLVFREAADTRSTGESAKVAWQHTLDPHVILNDITSFDDVLYATTIYGRARPHEHGQFLLDGARSFLPSKIDPNKPEGGDIVFRKVVWKNQFGAGRPPTAVGDLFIDFGFPGVAVGAVLIGVLARSLLGLLRGPLAGRQYRVALYAIALVILYELVVDTFSLALGFMLTLALPFLIAVHVFGRAPGVREQAGSNAA